MTRVLKLTFPGETLEVHMLNPGEHFDGFGGSRHPLIVGKTASLVMRRRSRMGLHDDERHITDPDFWFALAEMLGGRMDRPTEAVAGPPAAVAGDVP